MPNSKALLATALFSLFCSRAVFAQPGDEDLPLPLRVFVAAKIYSNLNLYFAHRAGVPGLDLDTEYKAYLENALAAKGRREFDLATLEFVAQFKNKHTQFDDQWLRQKYGQSLGFGVSLVDGKWVISSTRDARLSKGDIIRAIDGVDVESFVRDKRRFVNASSQRSAQSLVFDRAYLFPDRFNLELEDGRQILIERGSLANEASRPAQPPASEGRWLDEDSIGYVKIPSFNDANFEKTAIEFVKKFHAAKTLIIDVRNNGGGRTPYELVQELMDREWKSWLTSTPVHNARDRARGTAPVQLRIESVTSRPRAGAFPGRLLLLVNRFTCSACEDFVMPFKDNGRATIIGETTEGSSGQPYFSNFGNGMTFMVGAERHTFPNGSTFESVGIEPSVSIERHIADVRNDVDAVLERAKALAAAP